MRHVLFLALQTLRGALDAGDVEVTLRACWDAPLAEGIVRAVLRRHKIEADLPDETLLPLLEGLDGYAAADLEALVLLVSARALSRGEKLSKASMDRLVVAANRIEDLTDNHAITVDIVRQKPHSVD